MTEETANARAFARIAALDPQLSGLVRQGELPGLSDRVLLHAGPPFESFEAMPHPVQNSCLMAVLAEDWAADEAGAERLLRAGEIRLAPAQDHGILVPLAGISGPSTALLVVSDARHSALRRMSPVNEGMALCTRLGIRHQNLPAHLQWLNGPVADWLAGRLGHPMSLGPVLRAALAAGDDCHSRTVAASEILVAQLRDAGGAQVSDAPVLSFLEASPAFALNVWMAMCGLLGAAAEGEAGATLVTRAGGNGRHFGYQLAGQPGRWITSPAPVIRGRVEPVYGGRSACPALGDSALVDFMGLGGQALGAVPQLRDALTDLLPADFAIRPAKLLTGRLDLFGRAAVTDAQRAAKADTGPMVLLGMIDTLGQAGRIGGGCATVDGSAFSDGLTAI
ncbi:MULTISPECIES: DUF1116 domain-containing protein [Leisingera]|uniref:oxamate carbamoyltransferase subunit AllG family protein n=1 Tax=Leisingera TaxID=191028 RepID=UPI001C9814F1|nr:MULTISPECIES: DUF1116 domain-containing protein [Leisingera]MBY6058747.1 DUF1116 domain-containing protein [Leisingera daeponensis]